MYCKMCQVVIGTGLSLLHFETNGDTVLFSYTDLSSGNVHYEVHYDHYGVLLVAYYYMA